PLVQPRSLTPRPPRGRGPGRAIAGLRLPQGNCSQDRAIGSTVFPLSRIGNALDPPSRKRNSEPMRQQQKIHYGWIVVGVTFLTLLLGAGVRSAPGILMVPFEDEFHWSRSTISFAVAVNLLIYGLIGPFAAAMMERFGLRRMM